jgi:hypothetical protein
MEKIDLLTFDQFLQPARIDEHRQRILRARVEGHDLAPGLSHLGHHAPAFGDDQRSAACSGNGLRHLDRGALGAAGVETRDDLKYGRAMVRHERPL